MMSIVNSRKNYRITVSITMASINFSDGKADVLVAKSPLVLRRLHDRRNKEKQQRFRKILLCAA
jgi:hypothetical protein